MVRVSIFIVVVLIIIVLGSAGTPIGRAILPRSVRAVSKLLPLALIHDATANADGETIVLVGDQSNPKNVTFAASTVGTLKDASIEFTVLKKSGDTAFGGARSLVKRLTNRCRHHRRRGAPF